MYKADYKRWGEYKKWVRDHGILERRKRGITRVESRGSLSQGSRKNSVSKICGKEDFQPMRIGMCLSYTSVSQALTILQVSSHITSQKYSATVHCNKENMAPFLISSEGNAAGICVDSPGSNPAQCVAGISIWPPLWTRLLMCMYRSDTVSGSMAHAHGAVKSLKRKRIDLDQSSFPPTERGKSFPTRRKKLLLTRDLETGASAERLPLRSRLLQSNSQEDTGDYPVHGTTATSRFNVDYSNTLTPDSRAEWSPEKRAPVSPLPGVNQATDDTFEYSEFKGRGRYAKGYH